jgi:hypothetical protein
MKDCRLVWLILSALAAMTFPAGAQEPAKDTPKEAYFRIVNLLPVGRPTIDLWEGETPFITGMKSGFLQSYTALPKGEKGIFSVRQDGKRVGEFKVDRKKLPSYHTLVIYRQKDGSTAIRMEDDGVQPLKPAPPESPGEAPVVPKRLRIYVGGYDFPIKVTVASHEPMVSSDDLLFMEMDVTDRPPGNVGISFKDKYDEEITLYFPTDFSQSQAYSVFVSQRALKRARIVSYPDAVPPPEEDLMEAAPAMTLLAPLPARMLAAQAAE